MTPYGSAAETTTDRVRWVLACLVRLINVGRDAGWLDGAAIAAPADPAEQRAAIAARIAVTGPELRVAPVQWLATRLGLTEAELDLVWLLACIELDPGVARLAQVFGSSACPDLSVQIAQGLVAIESKQLDALHELGLIEISIDPRIPHHRRPVRINDRVLEIARGELRLDHELAGVAMLQAAPGSAETTTAVPELTRAFLSSPTPLVTAVGPKGSGRATCLVAAAASHGLGTLRIFTAALAREPGKLERQLRAVVREACLFDVVPLFEDIDAERDHPARTAIESAVRSFSGPVLATANEAVAWRERAVVVHTVDRPDRGARVAVWRDHLAGAADEIHAAAAESYQLRPGSIVAAARNAIAISDGTITAEAIHAGVRAQIGAELGTLATRIDWRQTWDDLVLPTDQFEQIIELVARARHRSTVLETWGFGAKVGKGHGLTALFSGPPGTGKTMVAGLVAAELGLDLYQVDLSKIVSKYIGETEKHLASLFDAAESGHAILLFDEADSLFAKRSEVKSSNDRYANLEVNYLLQRMESFTGISLLTTNHETAIDEAFRRRLALHVRFPVPDEEQRRALWEALIPAAAPVEPDLDMVRLARELEMSGGYIKNAVLRAAYLAAEDGSAISMTHLWRSARAEYEAMGKVAFQQAA